MTSIDDTDDFDCEDDFAKAISEIDAIITFACDEMDRLGNYYNLLHFPLPDCLAKINILAAKLYTLFMFHLLVGYHFSNIELFISRIFMNER